MILISPYQPTWPDEFQAIAMTLRQALGPLALRIDYNGQHTTRQAKITS